MNYIKQLQIDNLVLKGQLRDIQNEIDDFKAFLQTSPKFRNEPNQERKDWIAIADVIHRLQEIKNLV